MKSSAERNNRKSLEAISDFPDCSVYEGVALSSPLWCMDPKPLRLLSRTAIPLELMSKYEDKQQKAAEVAIEHREKLENSKMAGAFNHQQKQSTDVTISKAGETMIYTIYPFIHPSGNILP